MLPVERLLLGRASIQQGTVIGRTLQSPIRQGPAGACCVQGICGRLQCAGPGWGVIASASREYHTLAWPYMEPEKAFEKTAEDLQREYYNRLLDRYEAHYDDPTSQAYRRKYIFEPMFAGVDFSGTNVLEAMCGSGPTTSYLLERGAVVTGLDVSDSAVQSFVNRWPNCSGIRASIFDCGLPAESYDMVIVQAGLHHLHPRLEDAIEEIYRILKPGGYFCFSEPHAGSLYDGARNLWYRFDRDIFAENEASVDVEDMKRQNAGRFNFQVEHYLGNVAYFLVAQSMVLRIPLAAKKYYAPIAFALETLLGPLMGRKTAPLVACRWQKAARTGDFPR